MKAERSTTSDAGAGLPGSIHVLWDLREREQRGRTGLSTSRIVTAAIGFADEFGLGTLSMARIAERLDSATMSLYRHVSSKDELQALMVDMAYGMPPELEDGDRHWRAGLEQWARAFLEVFRRHPWMLQIPVSGPPLEPGQMSWLERGLRTLGRTGLTPNEKLSVMLLMVGYVRNNAQLSMGLVSENVSEAELMANYGQAMDKFVTAETFPAVRELIEAGTFESTEDDFGFGLQRVLDGVEVLVRVRAGENPLG
ncbi:TetR/AcrR family transcriptional regulator C-terminal domain-containing protein [Kitasatospora sp. NBC_01266]|jgi:AcrR family transcriptional regulator|uniref:TetR/AcrR family transcriptional regulator C-terminal domain-containing protein n=1 Tax=Kitasatospora sp. NBC_01266 TaxID=2903572 RepID=UPI002E2EF9EA|nr:TetR/AcrR family transcriptional regulator C-terminal domain-containing protein [Kitasatospora sp. NBC_01266]